jgi:hypothetical protein
LVKAFAINSNILPDDEYGVILVLNVRNTGTPSMAECCDLAVTIPGAPNVITGERLAFPPSLTLKNADNTKVIAIYTSQDALYDKLGTKPIMTGEMVRGVVMYGIRGVTYEALSNPGVKYVISLKDVTGKLLTGALVWSQTQNNPPVDYFPGLSNLQCVAPVATSSPTPLVLPPAGKGNGR